MTPKPITSTGNRSTRRYDRYNRSLVNRIEDLMDPSFLIIGRISLQITTGEREDIPTRRQMLS